MSKKFMSNLPLPLRISSTPAKDHLDPCFLGSDASSWAGRAATRNDNISLYCVQGHRILFFSLGGKGDRFNLFASLAQTSATAVLPRR